MHKTRSFKVGIIADKQPDNLEAFLKSELNFFYPVFLVLSEAMKFSVQKIVLTNVGGVLLNNGTWTGLIGMLNRSEIDISPQYLFMNEKRSQAISFTYPFFLDDVTFVTRNPHYTPQIFAIFRTVSIPVWLSTAVSFFSVTSVYCLLLKRRYPWDKIVLHVLAVSLKQATVIRPTRISESLLNFSWMIGAFFLTLSFGAVLLSFLSFPPQFGVRNVSELAKAVKEGTYSCMTTPGSSVPDYFSESDEENIKVIGDHIRESPDGFGTTEDFINLKDKNVASIDGREDIHFLKEKYFVSEDRFIQFMGALAVRKDFCCKKELDENILRIMAAGLYEKFSNERDFKIAFLKLSFEDSVSDTNRKLNLIDVGSAVLFLLIGHVISIFVLLFEIYSYNKVQRISRRIQVLKKVKLKRKHKTSYW